MDYWNAFKAAKMCVDALSRVGVVVEVENNFDLIPDLVEESGKGYLTPFLDPRLHNFTKQNCFWLTARCDGVLVMLGGARIDDVGMESRDFIASMFGRGYGRGCVCDVDEAVGRNITGRTAYFGDLHSNSSRGLGRQNVRYFTGIANHIASTQFRSDCVYSLMRSVDVLRGSADKNGFTSRIMQPITWNNAPDGWGNNEQLVYRGSADNDKYFNQIIQELDHTRSKQEIPRSVPQLSIPA